MDFSNCTAVSTRSDHMLSRGMYACLKPWGSPSDFTLHYWTSLRLPRLIVSLAKDTVLMAALHSQRSVSKNSGSQFLSVAGDLEHFVADPHGDHDRYCGTAEEVPQYSPGQACVCSSIFRKVNPTQRDSDLQLLTDGLLVSVEIPYGSL
jgi:hypothetical protein